jgi:DNA primase
MLRASSLAAKRKLELRVVELPAGSDPADLLQRDGAEAMRALVEQSVPFVRFRVERVLAQGDHSSPEGRDRMIEQLRPVFHTLPASAIAMRQELTRVVSERLGLPHSLAERALAMAPSGAPAGPGRGVEGSGTKGPAPTAGGERASGRVAGRGDRAGGGSLVARGASTERAFLALCIASPAAGAQALVELDLAESFTSELMRRAAQHLRSHLSDPHGGLPEDDPELASLVAKLVVEAGRESAREDMLEVQRLQLELARMDRQIQRTRALQGGEVNELAQRRTEVKRDFERAYARVLEETGERQG